MTVDQLLTKLAGAFPAFNVQATEAWAPVYRARLGKHEGPALAKAYTDTLGGFTVKASKSLFPMPADFEAHLPSGKLDLGKDNGQKLDLDGRKRRADSLFANWWSGQGARAAKGNDALRRALEDVARPIADVMAWDENPEPLALTRDQLKTACQRAISQERRLRYGQIPKDRFVWWQQITATAASWGIEITPDWWDDTTGKALTMPDEVETKPAQEPRLVANAKPISFGQRAALDAALALEHRAHGRTEYAAMLERRAAAAGLVTQEAMEMER